MHLPELSLFIGAGSGVRSRQGVPVLLQREIVVRQAGQAGIDDPRSHVRFGDGGPPSARWALEVSVLENLDRGIDFA